MTVITASLMLRTKTFSILILKLYSQKFFKQTWRHTRTVLLWLQTLVAVAGEFKRILCGIVKTVTNFLTTQNISPKPLGWRHTYVLLKNLILNSFYILGSANGKIKEHKTLAINAGYEKSFKKEYKNCLSRSKTKSGFVSKVLSRSQDVERKIWVA